MFDRVVDDVLTAALHASPGEHHGGGHAGEAARDLELAPLEAKLVDLDVETGDPVVQVHELDPATERSATS